MDRPNNFITLATITGALSGPFAGTSFREQERVERRTEGVTTIEAPERLASFLVQPRNRRERRAAAARARRR